MFFTKLLNDLCTPNKEDKLDPSSKDFATHKNKQIVLVLGTAVLAVWFAMFLEDDGMKTDQLISSLTYFITLILFLLMCRSQSKVLHVILFIILTFHRPITVMLDLDCIYFSLYASIVMTNVVYFLTKSKLLSALEGVIHLLYASSFYEEAIIELIYTVPARYIAKRFSQVMVGAVLWTIMSIIGTDNCFTFAFTQLKKAENEKEFLHKQKTLLLSFSHELRNLINSMTGCIQIALLEALDNPKMTEALSDAKVCSEMLLQYINNILDSGKDEIGELEVYPTSVQSYDLFNNIWKVCKEFIRKKSLNGSLKVDKNVPKSIKIDSYRLNQILMNLVSNAAKYTQKGFVSVTVDWDGTKSVVDDECFRPVPYYEGDDEEGLFEKEQNFSSFQNNSIVFGLNSHHSKAHDLRRSLIDSKGVLRIAVRDSGSGIAPEDLDKLFKKFSQFSGNTTTRMLGAGLGLYITKKLCHKMGGDIRAYSRVGVGTTFVVCLSVQVLADYDFSRRELDIQLFQRVFGNLKLKSMVVDDENLAQTVLTSYFKRISCEVINRASNGLEAFRKYQEHALNGEKPEIVTMDICMPEYDGKFAAKMIRQFEREQKLKSCLLIMISGNCSESEIRECLKKDGDIQADAFLKKPVTIDDLIHIIISHKDKTL